MAFELIYTSVPQGLKPGKSGFCRVAQTQGLSERHATSLESLTAYKEIFPAHDPNAATKNPVAFNYWNFDDGARRVLARVAFAGLDYSGRSNKVAHCLLLSQEEVRCAGGPAFALAGLEAAGALAADAESARKRKGYIPGQMRIPDGSSPSCLATQWEETAGDAGWAGTLAASFLDGRRTAFLVFEPGGRLDGRRLLGLLAEAQALLPESLRWEATFSTCFLGLQPGSECHWRCVPSGSAALAQAEKTGALVLDLTKPLGHAPDSPLAAAARTGEPPPLPAVPPPSIRVEQFAPLPETPWPESVMPSPSAAPEKAAASRRGGLRLRTAAEATATNKAADAPRRHRKGWLAAVATVSLLAVAGIAAGAFFWFRGNHDALPAVASSPAQIKNKVKITLEETSMRQDYDSNSHSVKFETEPKDAKSFVVVTYEHEEKKVKPVDAGSYSIIAQIPDDNEKYSGKTEGTLVIKPKQVPGTWDPKTLTCEYNGKPHDVAWKSKDKDIKIIYAYKDMDGKDTKPPTEIGEYAITAKSKDKNYALVETAADGAVQDIITGKLVITAPRLIAVYAWPWRSVVSQKPFEKNIDTGLYLSAQSPAMKLPEGARFIVSASSKNNDVGFEQSASIIIKKAPGFEIGRPNTECNKEANPKMELDKESKAFNESGDGINFDFVTLSKKGDRLMLEFGNCAHVVYRENGERDHISVDKITVFDPKSTKPDSPVAIIQMKPIKITAKRKPETAPDDYIFLFRPVGDYDTKEYDYSTFFNGACASPPFEAVKDEKGNMIGVKINVSTIKKIDTDTLNEIKEEKNKAIGDEEKRLNVLLKKKSDLTPRETDEKRELETEIKNKPTNTDTASIVKNKATKNAESCKACEVWNKIKDDKVKGEINKLLKQVKIDIDRDKKTIAEVTISPI